MAKANDKGQAKTWQEIIAKQFGVTLTRDGKTLEGLSINAAGDAVVSSTDPEWSYPFRGYVSPLIGSPFLSDERQFNLMFRTALGAVDPMQDGSALISGLTSSEDLHAAVAERFPKETAQADHMLSKALASADRGKIIRALIEHLTGPQMAFLRPETAQAMFVQFKNVMDTSGQKPPFGIAQMGKSFRNEVTVEHFIFRSCEFEQMEMEFFCEPGSQTKWMQYWKDQRM